MTDREGDLDGERGRGPRGAQREEKMPECDRPSHPAQPEAASDDGEELCWYQPGSAE